MTTERKRGRPRKQAELGGTGWQRLPLEAMPSDFDKDALIALLVTYLSARPHIHDPCGDLKTWLDATAQAVDSGDVVKTGFYAFGAMRCRALLAYQEPMPTATITPPGAISLSEQAKIVRQLEARGLPLSAHDLAAVGKVTLGADKKRGVKGHIVRR